MFLSFSWGRDKLLMGQGQILANAIFEKRFLLYQIFRDEKEIALKSQQLKNKFWKLKTVIWLLFPSFSLKEIIVKLLWLIISQLLFIELPFNNC